jgi:hypothetical protein
MMPVRRLKHGVRTTTIFDHTVLWATWPPENSLNPARQLRTDSDLRFSHNRWIQKWVRVKQGKLPLKTWIHSRGQIIRNQIQLLFPDTFSGPLAQYVGDDAAVDVGQAEVSSGVTVR